MRKRVSLRLAEPETGVGLRTGTARNGCRGWSILDLFADSTNGKSLLKCVPRPPPGLQSVCLSNAFVFGEQLSALLL